ncbi:hypothetical protein OKW21_004478 [Catalinimonas alkaloidigena]|nr:hypothetical protein [Catalinimonas alkaloidigena]
MSLGPDSLQAFLLPYYGKETMTLEEFMTLSIEYRAQSL